MNTPTLRSNILLLLTAIIWGFAFVAQRIGMDYVGPFTFNGLRFALGGFSLLPLLLSMNRQRDPGPDTGLTALLLGGVSAGIALFLGASLQQVGIVYTTVGNAGFITGLYVVLVPLMGLFLKQKASIEAWTGACLAAVGMYFLSVTEQFTIAFGDLLELLGAFCWAAHVLLIGRLARRMDALKIAFVQFLSCSVLSLLAAALTEKISIQGISDAAVPIAYGGLLSVGIAHTLQVIAQRHAHAAHAAIILSLEAVFAALGGCWLLGEALSQRGIFGSALMLTGILLSQFQLKFPGCRRSQQP
ncbi:EamA family transporter [candidate division KSB3 bacterium]|uniref:EamA family transporter n=1 Tax=candidate division KSB3 bacterium TaxID=2044937 RepID=A0A2G6E2D9_9BACT|nr:MAG: EamA family transporter [candidate division KSB3 bacterium]PIE28734.1 MAG: EamA family transporter [candidate division KSB3 bacterium]